MSLFQWESDYNVGVEPIDLDHREVLRLASELETALTGGAPLPELLERFDKAFDAIQSGMEREEVLLKQAGYPAYRFHKREHDDLLQILMEFRAKVGEGTATICTSSLAFLGGWLVSHFRSEDRCAGNFLLQPAKAG